MHSPEKTTGQVEESCFKQNSSFLTTTSSLSSDALREIQFQNNSSLKISNFITRDSKKRSFKSFSKESSGGPKKSKTAKVIRKPRKESSLKQICTSILKNFLLSGRSEIRLNKFASELKVERRRIYDIVNVLEGFDVVHKKGKNLYQWRGLEGFRNALVTLQDTQKDLIPGLKVFSFEHKDPRVKKKSLTFLSIKLLKLFIIYQENINFKELIKLFGEKYLELKLNNDDKDLKKSENKNKIRRLYDIVNVFKSLGLIEKVINSSGKSVFQFKGVQGLLENIKFLKEEKSIKNKTPLSSDSLVRVIVFNDLDDNKNKNKNKWGSDDLTDIHCNKDHNLKRIKRSSLFNSPDQGRSYCNGLSSFDSLFNKMQYQKELIPSSLLNLRLICNNKQIPIIGSNNKLQNISNIPEIPQLGLRHLKKSIRNKIKSQEKKSENFINNKKQDFEKPTNSEKSRFIKFKKKLLTSKNSTLRNTLEKIQQNYFEEEHTIFFKTVFTMMDHLHMYV